MLSSVTSTKFQTTDLEKPDRLQKKSLYVFEEFSRDLRGHIHDIPWCRHLPPCSVRGNHCTSGHSKVRNTRKQEDL